MIDLEGLVQKTMNLESKYYALLETHQQLVHAYEELSLICGQQSSLIAKAFQAHPNLDMDIEAYADRSGRGMED